MFNFTESNHDTPPPLHAHQYKVRKKNYNKLFFKDYVSAGRRRGGKQSVYQLLNYAFKWEREASQVSVKLKVNGKLICVTVQACCYCRCLYGGGFFYFIFIIIILLLFFFFYTQVHNCCVDGLEMQKRRRIGEEMGGIKLLNQTFSSEPRLRKSLCQNN